MAKPSDHARFASMRSPSSWIRFVAPQLLFGGTGLLVGLVLGVVMGLSKLGDFSGFSGNGNLPIARAGGPGALVLLVILALIALFQVLAAIAPPVVFACLGLCVGVVAASMWDLMRLLGKAGHDSLWRVKLWSAGGTAIVGGLGIYALWDSPKAVDLTSAAVVFVAYGLVGAAIGGVLGILVVLWARRG